MALPILFAGSGASFVLAPGRKGYLGRDTLARIRLHQPITPDPLAARREGRQRRHDAAYRTWRFGVRVAKFTEVGAAVVRRQEVHEPLVLFRRNHKQRQQGTVAAAARAQSAANQLEDVMASDVTIQEQRVDMFPER